MKGKIISRYIDIYKTLIDLLLLSNILFLVFRFLSPKAHLIHPIYRVEKIYLTPFRSPISEIIIFQSL